MYDLGDYRPVSALSQPAPPRERQENAVADRTEGEDHDRDQERPQKIDEPKRVHAGRSEASALTVLIDGVARR